MTHRKTQMPDPDAMLLIWIAGGLTAAGIVLARIYPAPIAASVCFLSAFVSAGIPILNRAVRSLRMKVVSIELLVSIACIGACLIGEFSEAAIVSFLFRFGAWLEQKTVRKTRSAIRALTEMTPVKAVRMTGDEVEEIDAEDVAIGDLLLVRTGDQIPADGIVRSGEGYVREAGITGESVPAKKMPESAVYAGTFVTGGTLKIEAVKVGEDTTFARIIALVEEAQDARSPAERFIDRFARYYTPAVIVIAVLVLLLTRNPDTAITVLVLACPGALVIGAPMANVAGIGRGAREGILLKGGESIHTFARTDTVVFDKTGTLTEGRPKVVWEKRLTENAETALSLAAAAERVSNHPLGEAIRNHAGDPPVPENMRAEPLKGRGIEAETPEHRILAGSLRLMEESGIPVRDTVREEILRQQEKACTVVLIAMDGELTLLLSVADAVKTDAAKSLNTLRTIGIRKLVMLTGDNEKTAAAVAKQLDITETAGGLLPQEKMEAILRMQKEGHTVTFVGDGINDSPALTAANTGIAMGNGTDAAIDCSDVVLIRSDLESMVRALKLARRTRRILRMNIAIAVGTVLLLLIGLFAGVIHMSLGMLIHEGSIMAVILNAMRLLIMKEERT